MAKEHAERVRKYFKPFPRWTIWVIVIGVVGLVASGAGVPTIVGIAGIALILAGIAGILFWRAKPSDQEMDRWINEDVEKLKPVAVNKTGLDGVKTYGDTVVVKGPRFWNTGGAFVGVKRGKDGEIRFTPIEVTIINFTKDQLVAYQCALDLMTDKPLSESTDEYFYQDVVSVSTQSKTTTYDKSTMTRQGRKALKPLMKGGRLQLNSSENFVLTTAGGTSLEVFLRDPRLIEMAGGGRIPTGTAEKAIGAVRTMLRVSRS